MIERDLRNKLKYLSTKYPVVSLTGPRQSGKSTLLQELFYDYQYVNLENIDIRRSATDDPRGFLEKYERAIIDEAQYTPELFSYIQVKTDATNEVGQYILSGSQNFLLLKSISQSLAGRVGSATLLPLSLRELRKWKPSLTNEDIIFQGGYPRIYNVNLLPGVFYEDYIKTYINRDVNELLRVRDIASFGKFLQLLAMRAGQTLNIATLANDCDIKVDTANSWLSILESSFVIYLLQPYYSNIGKRLTKSPKLYFYDSGLLCHLLKIRTVAEMLDNPMFGSIFENFTVVELYKDYINQGAAPRLYFMQDSNGNEVDIVDDTNTAVKMYEIKSGKTAKPEFAKALNLFAGELGVAPEDRFVVYRGEELKMVGVSYIGIGLVGCL